MITDPRTDSATARPTLFPSFFLGGFEASTHVLRSGRRLDLVESTRHEVFALADYRRLMNLGLRAARDGVRWHLIEYEPGKYDFSSARAMVRAALEAGIEVVWDLLHFGWPDHVDPFTAEFVPRFAEFASRFATVLESEGDRRPSVIPVNEISFLAFAGGEEGFFNPFLEGRGDELKRRLVETWIAGARAVRAVLPSARVLASDPMIHVLARPGRSADEPGAAGHRAAQYAALDMITGRTAPELGGSEELLDAIGLNYYVHNQWWYPGGHGSVIAPSSLEYRPLRDMLRDWYERFRKPVFIAETGIEDDERPAWLAYVGHEARAARRLGVDLQGVCLYPIVNHPGWEDDRHCRNGLWDYPDSDGNRAIFEPLARELVRQQGALEHAAREETPEETRELLRHLDEIARSISEATEESRS